MAQGRRIQVQAFNNSHTKQAKPSVSSMNSITAATVICRSQIFDSEEIGIAPEYSPSLAADESRIDRCIQIHRRVPILFQRLCGWGVRLRKSHPCTDWSLFLAATMATKRLMWSTTEFCDLELFFEMEVFDRVIITEIGRRSFRSALEFGSSYRYCPRKPDGIRIFVYHSLFFFFFFYSFTLHNNFSFLIIGEKLHSSPPRDMFFFLFLFHFFFSGKDSKI